MSEPLLAIGGTVDTRPTRCKLISFCFVAMSMLKIYGTLLLGDALEYRAALLFIFPPKDT